MDAELRVALREGYFVVHYQPKVGADRKLAGFEALVRMNHRVHGLIPRMSFIPVAESSGLIVPLGAWVLDEACRQIAEWQSRKPEPGLRGGERIAGPDLPPQFCQVRDGLPGASWCRRLQAGSGAAGSGLLQLTAAIQLSDKRVSETVLTSLCSRRPAAGGKIPFWTRTST
jgi:hypothetical protein